MSSHTLGLLIGGIIPAVVFSFSNLAMKGGVQEGISLPYYLMVVGIAVLCMGVLALFFHGGHSQFSAKSGLLAFGAGATWALGVFCVTYAIHHYGAPIGVLAPLFNLNSLITVLLALWVFSEWQQVKVPQLLIGSVLIVAGGVIVAKA